MFFKALPQVKNQHLTALNKRRRLEWCTSMLERLGEATHSGTTLARHTSKIDALDDNEIPLRLKESTDGDHARSDGLWALLTLHGRCVSLSLA